MAKLMRKLGERYELVHVCYEAGPTGYGLYRQILALGHTCTVVAPSLIPRRPGDRVKTNRRDAQSLARLLRAGELTAVCVLDETHEAVRGLVRTRARAIENYRRKRQHVTSFLLRHGRSYQEKPSWKGRHLRWLDGQAFAHPAQRLAFQEMLSEVRAAAERIGRLEAALIEIVDCRNDDGESNREGGEQPETPKDQPGLVPVPDRRRLRLNTWYSQTAWLIISAGNRCRR